MMPAAGPYGITQVDAAGLISNYQAMQRNRVEMLVLQKQSEAADRAAEKQSSIQAAVAKYAKGGDQSPASDGAQGAVNAYAPPADPLAPLPDAAPSAPPQPRGPSAADREGLFSSLIALDPKVAGEYIDAFSKMDKAKVDQFTQRNTNVMQIMAGLSQLPAAERPAAVQQAADELKGLGYTDEQIAGFDPSDANLKSELVRHMDAQRIVQFTNQEADNTRADDNQDSLEEYRQGSLINTRRGQDLTDKRGRRGQDIADKRGRRGQDIASGDRRYVADRRPPTKGAAPKPVSTGDGAIIKNPTTGERMQLRDGKWVKL